MPDDGSQDNTKSHQFGGDWTELKLGIVEEYLRSYTHVLKGKGLRTAFIDAFAGTGYREDRPDELDVGATGLPFPDLAHPEPQELLEGSARRALRIDPPFDKYVFIERSSDRCAVLEQLKDDFPGLASRIDVQQGDANDRLQALCGTDKDWRRHRAVLFLDPYGMQVKWSTIVAIARTQSIDLWLLFPLGVGVNRLLTRSGDIPAAWRRKLNEFLGTEDWYEVFYRAVSTPNLFGDDEQRIVKVRMEVIGRFFNERLASVFADVAPHPAVLRNSTNSPLYLLCFAVGNPSTAARAPALRIANYLLNGVR